MYTAEDRRARADELRIARQEQQFRIRERREEERQEDRRFRTAGRDGIEISRKINGYGTAANSAYGLFTSIAGIGDSFARDRALQKGDRHRAEFRDEQIQARRGIDSGNDNNRFGRGGDYRDTDGGMGYSRPKGAGMYNDDPRSNVNNFVAATALATANPTPDNIAAALGAGNVLPRGADGKIILRGEYVVDKPNGPGGVGVRFDGTDNYSTVTEAMAVVSSAIAPEMNVSALTRDEIARGLAGDAPSREGRGKEGEVTLTAAQTTDSPASGAGAGAAAGATGADKTTEAGAEKIVAQSTGNAPSSQGAQAGKVAADVAAQSETGAKGKDSAAKEGETSQLALNKKAQVLLERLGLSTGDGPQGNHAKYKNGSQNPEELMDGVVGRRTKGALTSLGIDPTKPITAETLAKIEAQVKAKSAEASAAALKAAPPVSTPADWDTNRDGKLSDEERATGNAALKGAAANSNAAPVIATATPGAQAPAVSKAPAEGAAAKQDYASMDTKALWSAYETRLKGSEAIKKAFGHNGSNIVVDGNYTAQEADALARSHTEYMEAALASTGAKVKMDGDVTPQEIAEARAKVASGPDKDILKNFDEMIEVYRRDPLSPDADRATLIARLELLDNNKDAPSPQAAEKAESATPAKVAAVASSTAPSGLFATGFPPALSEDLDGPPKGQNPIAMALAKGTAASMQVAANDDGPSSAGVPDGRTLAQKAAARGGNTPA